MATRYFAGNSLAAFNRTAVALVDVTTANTFDSTYVSTAISFGTTANFVDYISTPTLNISGTFWVIFEDYGGGGTSNTGNMYFIILNAGTNVFRLISVTASSVKAQYWNGSAWVDTGSTWTFTTTVRNRVAIKIIPNSGFELWANNSQITTGSGWTGGSTTVTDFRWGSISGSSGTVVAISQVAIADYDIRDVRLRAPALNGNSASNTGAASGVYTDVNETTLDDGTAIVVAASGNKAGQTKASISVPTGMVIGGFVMNARGRVGGAITDGKHGIRSGGTNYSSSGRTYSGGYEPRCYISATDPATSARFTESGFNSAEPYLEAV